MLQYFYIKLYRKFIIKSFWMGVKTEAAEAEAKFAEKEV